MTPQALAALQLLATFGGVALNSFAVWGDHAAGIATSVSEGWLVNTSGAYRMTQAGELALAAGLTA